MDWINKIKGTKGSDMNNSSNDEKPQQRKVKLVGDPTQVEEVYADGISGVVGRGGIIKLDCYRFLGVDGSDDTEVRQMVQRLVLPTTAIPELAAAIKGVAEAGQKSIEEARQRAEETSDKKGGKN